MHFTSYMPTRLIFGRDCIRQHTSTIKPLGTRAFIVTGARSARMNGSLQQITQALGTLNIPFVLFDEVEANPSVETVRRAAEQLKKENCDFVIGIGGGSPMDAAKAIALLGCNTLGHDDLFSGRFDTPPLPLIAIPTTAGTGSEVTPYSILTDKRINNKRNLSSDNLFPAVSFLDPAFTDSLPLDITVNTAVDAMSHAIEGFLSRRAIVLIRPLAMESLSMLGPCLKSLAAGHLPSPEGRETLLYASMLAGIVIAHSGTTCVHAMGYPLTYYKNIDHGRANGLLLSAYLKFLSPHRTEVGQVLRALGLESLSDFSALMDQLLGAREVLSKEDLACFVDTSLSAKGVVYTNPSPDEGQIKKMFEDSFLN